MMPLIEWHCEMHAKILRRLPSRNEIDETESESEGRRCPYEDSQINMAESAGADRDKTTRRACGEPRRTEIRRPALEGAVNVSTFTAVSIRPSNAPALRSL
jgi:hypothetical protein